MAFDKPELLVRSRLPGDKILCKGMHRSLRTLCNEARLSQSEREALLIFTLESEIIWIPGLALRDNIISTDSCRHTLSITVFPATD
jgi:tRNA(Ile)-lysidine synthetase-like protein